MGSGDGDVHCCTVSRSSGPPGRAACAAARESARCSGRVGSPCCCLSGSAGPVAASSGTH